MGYYIETPENLDKAKQIIELHGARPAKFDNWPLTAGQFDDLRIASQALVCVVNNGFFDAAAYCYDYAEYLSFATDKTGRLRKWLLLDIEKARQLSRCKY